MIQHNDHKTPGKTRTYQIRTKNSSFMNSLSIRRTENAVEMYKKPYYIEEMVDREQGVQGIQAPRAPPPCSVFSAAVRGLFPWSCSEQVSAERNRE